MAMVFGVLQKVKGGGKLGQENGDHVAVGAQNANRIAPHDQLTEFLADPFLRNVSEQMATGVDLTVGFTLKRKSEHRCKANGAQDPQSVLLKSLFGVSDGADETVREILAPAEGINDPALGVIRHGIDGEIPAGKIVAEAFGIGDREGMTVVGIVAVHAIGGDLQRLSLQNHGDRAVLLADLDRSAVAKAGEGLIGQGACGQIPVVGSSAQERIADASANGVGLMSLCFQSPDCKHGGS